MTEFDVSANAEDLSLARTGHIAALRTRLETQVREFCTCSGAMDETEKLTDEALTFLRLGDMDQVIHLLQLRDGHPKFSSVMECKQAYAAAMAERRGVAA